jgi:stage V sporulation protein SpoVS
LEALGPDAVGQAVKSIAIGRANLETDNVDICFAPQFRTMFLSNGRRSALVLAFMLSSAMFSLSQELLVLPVKK